MRRRAVYCLYLASESESCAISASSARSSSALMNSSRKTKPSGSAGASPKSSDCFALPREDGNEGDAERRDRKGDGERSADEHAPQASFRDLRGLLEREHGALELRRQLLHMRRLLRHRGLQ